MRTDALGMFWTDLPKSKKRGPRAWGPQPDIPQTRWVTPTSFPNLTAAKVIGLDTETYDPELLEAGPGWGRGKGHLVGVSIAVEDGTAWYFPMRHETQPEHNIDPAAVLGWLTYTLRDSRPKVGANLIYDIGWLKWEGVDVGGKLYDVQFAEALLDSETPHVALDALANKYLAMGKETVQLYEWLAKWNKAPVNGKQRKWIYKSPPCLAGPYAEADAALPIRILEQQWPALQQRGVAQLFDIECRLINLLVDMRLRGVPVDVKRAEQLHDKLDKDLGLVGKRLRSIAGKEVNPNASASIAEAFDALGIPKPMAVSKTTGKNTVTFAKDYLKLVDHDLARLLLDYRALDKVRSTFVKGYILDKHVDGRVFGSFHPLRGGGHGARSGRVSSSDPNLQNIPIRTELGKAVRRCFAPLHGGLWVTYDFSQIEYRMLAHFAVGQGAQELRAAYNSTPDIDYHQHVIDLIRQITGTTLERREAKTINFGGVYGMGVPKLRRQLGLNKVKGTELLDAYHTGAPFIKATMAEASKEASVLGHITTILGRKSDFPHWTTKQFDPNAPILSYEAACEKWGRHGIERAFLHKALNRKLQGSAADIMKKAMVDAYEGGLFADAACGIPCLTVHDELDFEYYGNPEAPCWKELTHTMQNAVPTSRVPILVDKEVGVNWGDTH